MAGIRTPVHSYSEEVTLKKIALSALLALASFIFGCAGEVPAEIPTSILEVRTTITSDLDAVHLTVTVEGEPTSEVDLPGERYEGYVTTRNVVRLPPGDFDIEVATVVTQANREKLAISACDSFFPRVVLYGPDRLPVQFTHRQAPGGRCILRGTMPASAPTPTP